MSEKISHSKRIQSDVNKSAPRSSFIVTTPLRFYSKLNFPYRVYKNPEISNFMKIRLMGAELIHIGERRVG